LEERTKPMPREQEADEERKELEEKKPRKLSRRA
jgi:hypothetical protein